MPVGCVRRIIHGCAWAEAFKIKNGSQPADRRLA